MVWGWLPDKTDTSYKIFFLLVQKEMKKLGLQLDVKSILCDFELNIMKSLVVFFTLKIVFKEELTGMGSKHSMNKMKILEDL